MVLSNQQYASDKGTKELNVSASYSDMRRLLGHKNSKQFCSIYILFYQIMYSTMVPHFDVEEREEEKKKVASTHSPFCPCWE